MLPGQQLTSDSLLKLLRRKRWYLIVPAFLGVLGGLLYSRSQPSLYRSDAVIQVVPQRVPESYVSATVTERVEDRLRALAQQVLSRTQLEKLITDFGLFPKERQRMPLEDVIVKMAERVRIEPLVAGQTSRRDAQSEAFRVLFDYEDPMVAQKVAEQIASYFVTTNKADRGRQADQTSSFLEAQLADARGRLEVQEQKLKTFREQNSGRLPTQVQTNMQAGMNVQMALQAIVESLARDRDRKLVFERLYADATADPAGGQMRSGPPGAGEPAGATPRQRLDAARVLLAQLETRLSPKHPDIVRAKRLIADLEKQVAAEELTQPLSPEAEEGGTPATPEAARRRAQLRAMRTEIESIDRQIVFKEREEKRLRGLMAEYQSRLESVPGIESEWLALTRDYETLQETYRQLLAKSENSKMAASLETREIGEQFRILDPPRVPLKPHSPKRPLINLAGTAAGLGIGVLLLGLAYVRDTTMRSEADVRGAIDLPVLALLPFVSTEADVRRASRRKRLVSAAVVAACVGTAALGWYLRLWKYVL
jgi:polysaccharide chain length determinant protein (PEP-CTERM system associated)